MKDHDKGNVYVIHDTMKRKKKKKKSRSTTASSSSYSNYTSTTHGGHDTALMINHSNSRGLNDGNFNHNEDDEINFYGRKPSTLYPFLYSLVVGIGALMFGFGVGYTGPIKNVLQSKTEGIGISSSQQDIFGSVANIGAMGGAIVAGALVDVLGRTRTIFTAGLLFLAGFLLIAFCSHVSQAFTILMVGRVFCGVAVGMVSLCVPVYIAEIAPAALRGGLGSINQLAITTGVFLVYMIGTEVDWKQLAWISAIFAGGLCVTVLFVPQSPRWLCKKGRSEQAQSSLKRLRGEGYNTNMEIKQILDGLENEGGNQGSIADLFRGGAKKALIVGVLLMLFQQFSGINVFVFYSASIFEDAGVSDANLSAILFSIVQMIVTGISCILVDKAGRRALLMTAGIGMCASLILLGYYFWLKDNGYYMSGKIALVSSFVYISAFSLGFGAIPWVIMSEIFPGHLRGIASSFATCVNWTSAFIVTEVFSSMKSAMGESGVFWFYAAVCFLGVVYVLIFVPETKGRTLEQIEGYFAGKPSPDQARDGAGTGGALVKLTTLLAVLFIGVCLFVSSF
eukprot:m.106628 g.106628  ORF g.106628 m.106628 type:complete len:565 (-) comp9158_c1_seq5:1908-3602(-)